MPVLADQVRRELVINSSGIYLDGTVGAGGHAEVILESLTSKGRLIGFDRDPEAVASARARLAHFGQQALIVQADYRHLADYFRHAGIAEIHGALLDLGLSSLQLDNPSRGFAYRFDGPLDLRFDTTSGSPASSWLAHANEQQIADALYEFGEERHARRIARAIVAEKERTPDGIQTTGQLIAVIRRVVRGGGLEVGRSAARVFQALRIVVNDELAAIGPALNDAIDLLADHGRLAVIAYHSLEDRIVKNTMRDAARECTCSPALGQCTCGANPRGRLVQRRAIRPDEAEIHRNPRAKAARLRIFERLRTPGGAA